MHVESIRDHCLAKPGVTESFPFDEDTLVFKVMSKMFLLISLEKGDRFNAKCDPDRGIELRQEWEEIQPGYHMSKVHWNTVLLTGRLSDELIRELIDHSYDLVRKGLKKAEREELDRMG